MKDVQSMVSDVKLKYGLSANGLSDNAASAPKWTASTIQYTGTPQDNNNVTYYYLSGSRGGTHDVNMPVNEASVVRLVVSMAHAFTYEIEDVEQLKNFTKYSTGLFEYFCKKCKDH